MNFPLGEPQRIIDGPATLQEGTVFLVLAGAAVGLRVCVTGVTGSLNDGYYFNGYVVGNRNLLVSGRYCAVGVRSGSLTVRRR